MVRFAAAFLAGWLQISMPRAKMKLNKVNDGWRWVAMGLLLALTACNTVPVVIDPPEPPNVSQCLLGPTPDVPEPPLFAWELPVYLVEVLGILTEERTLRQGEHDCIGGMQAEGVVK